MATPSSAFRLYLLGLGSWFVPLGIQMVLFSWLAAIVLHMNAFYVGLAQVALMAPGILFLPLGGLVADRRNARRLLLLYHCLYALPPLVLGLVLWAGGLSYPLLIAYGLAAGSISAFAVPTRDALLPTVAGRSLPRAVALATALQFVGQLVGIAFHILCFAAQVEGLGDEGGAHAHQHAGQRVAANGLHVLGDAVEGLRHRFRDQMVAVPEDRPPCPSMG